MRRRLDPIDAAVARFAGSLILTAPADELRTLWHVSAGFEDSRSKVRRPKAQQSSKPALHLASAFIGRFSNSPRDFLLDNALLSVALAVEAGLESDEDTAEVVRMLTSPPLGKPGVYERLAVRCSLCSRL